MPRNDAQPIPQAQSGHHAVAPRAAETVTDLPYVRLTQRARAPRRRRGAWTLLALVLVGHVLVVWVAYTVLRPAPQQRTDGRVFRVTLIEPATRLPPPPLVMPPPLPGQAPATPPRHVHREAPAPGAMSATLEGVKGPPLELFDSNGRIRVPATAATQPAPAPAFTAPLPSGSSVMTIKTPIGYKPTRFNKAWAPLDESLGAKTVGRAFDKAVEKTTVTKTIHLPGGIKVKCGASPLVLGFGCAPPPPPKAPPPELENDVRLSLPPATTLTGEKVVLPAPASSTQPPPPASSRSGA